MCDSILLPADGSEHAAKIVHHAAELAQWTEATDGPTEFCINRELFSIEYRGDLFGRDAPLSLG